MLCCVFFVSYPLWDVETAVHVLSTGTYRLLPEVIETRLVEEHQLSAAAAAHAHTANLRPKLSDATIAATLGRLHATLHLHLLSTPLPHALSHIDIREGMAYLTFGDEFELGVSLRMGPQNAAQAEAAEAAPNAGDAESKQRGEEARINWRLFSLRVLANVDIGVADSSSVSSPPPPLLNDAQVLHLIVLLNHMSFDRPNPLLLFYDTLHTMMLGVLMDILHAQSLNLSRIFGMHDTTVEYAQHEQIINIRYWTDAKHMPVDAHDTGNGQEAGAGTSTMDPRGLLSPCLQILVDSRSRLSLRHNPPLPPCPEVPELLRFQLRALSLPHLLGNVLAHHGNQRIALLFALMQREAKRHWRRVVGPCEMEIVARHSSNDAHSGRKPVGVSPTSPSPVVPRHYLLLRLLPGYTVEIHTDAQTGRFVLEWSAASLLSASSSSNVSGMLGASSLLHRLLYAETIRLNASIAGAFDSVMHLKLACLTAQLASQCASLPNVSPRHRVSIMHTPFAGRHDAHATIAAAAHHLRYEPEGAAEGSHPDSPASAWHVRPGFGPFTVVVQLSGHSTQQYLLLQLNPYEQLTPNCFFVQTEQHVPAGQEPHKKPALHTSGQRVTRAWIEYLRPLSWLVPASSSACSADPSLGFVGSAYRAALASLLYQAESLQPLSTIQREIQTHFKHVVTTTHICEPGSDPTHHSNGGGDSGVEIMQQLRDAVRAGAQWPTDSTDAAAPGLFASPRLPPYLLVQLPFPLSVSLDSARRADSSDSIEGMARSLAQVAICAAPPRVFAGSNDAGESPSLVAFVCHPLIAQVLGNLRRADASAAESGEWQRIQAAVVAQWKQGNGPQQQWLNVSSQCAMTGVVSLAYDVAQPMCRLLYDLDNLCSQLELLSSFLRHTSLPGVRSSPSAPNSVLSVGASGSAGGMGEDEFVEHDGSGLLVSLQRQNLSSAAVAAAACAFPSDFFRVVGLSCTGIVLAYANSAFRGPDERSQRSVDTDEDEPQPALCTITIARQQAEEACRRDPGALTRLYSSHSVSALADFKQHRVTQTPRSWPQLPFLAADFNDSRSSALSPLVRLLHTVWLSAGPMVPICRFLCSVHRWQRELGLGSSHWLVRTHPPSAQLHCIAESATRLRFLYGQPTKVAGHAHMWRNRTDLRLAADGQIVQDFQAGRPTQRQTTAAGDNQAAGDDSSQPAALASGSSLSRGHGMVSAGKLSGDVTSYLHLWYKNVFMRALPGFLKQHESPLLVAGMKFELHRQGADSSNLAEPSIRIVIDNDKQPTQGTHDAAADDSSARVLSPCEVSCVHLYFAHRIVSPPYTLDAMASFYALVTLPHSSLHGKGAAANAANAAGEAPTPQQFTASWHCVRAMIALWAMELLQAHPFPHPFPPAREAVDALRPMLPPECAMDACASASLPACLSVRVCTVARSPFEFDFQLDTHIVSFILECAESRTSDSTLCVAIPLAFDLRSGVLSRWEVHRTQAHIRLFTPIRTNTHGAQVTPPNAFESLVHAVHWIRQHTIKQITDMFTEQTTTANHNYATTGNTQGSNHKAGHDSAQQQNGTGRH